MRRIFSALGALVALLSLPAVAATDTLSGPVTMQLRDGQLLTGTLRSGLDTSLLRLSIGSGDTLLVPRKAVGAIHRQGPRGTLREADSSSDGWNPDPSCTRGLALPNGYMLKQGQGFFVQNELIVSQFGFGITDWLNVVAGSALPFLFVDGGANLLVAGKMGGSIGPAHGSIGWMEMFAGDGSVGGPYGGLSLGNERGNVTVSYSHILAPEDSDESLDWYSFAANLRTGRHIALLGEIWMIRPSGETPQTLIAPGIRLMSGGLSGDLAFVFLPEVDVPLPWVNIAYAF